MRSPMTLLHQYPEMTFASPIRVVSGTDLTLANCTIPQEGLSL